MEKFAALLLGSSMLGGCANEHFILQSKASRVLLNGATTVNSSEEVVASRGKKYFNTDVSVFRQNQLVFEVISNNGRPIEPGDTTNGEQRETEITVLIDGVDSGAFIGDGKIRTVAGREIPAKVMMGQDLCAPGFSGTRNGPVFKIEHAAISVKAGETIDPDRHSRPGSSKRTYCLMFLYDVKLSPQEVFYIDALDSGGGRLGGSALRIYFEPAVIRLSGH